MYDVSAFPWSTKGIVDADIHWALRVDGGLVCAHLSCVDEKALDTGAGWEEECQDVGIVRDAEAGWKEGCRGVAVTEVGHWEDTNRDNGIRGDWGNAEDVGRMTVAGGANDDCKDIDGEDATAVGILFTKVIVQTTDLHPCN